MDPNELIALPDDGETRTFETDPDTEVAPADAAAPRRPSQEDWLRQAH